MKSFVTQLSEVSLHDLLGAHVSFIDSAFVDMIASRVRRPLDAPCLTELGLWMNGTGWTYGLDKEDENVLNSLEGEGLDLVGFYSCFIHLDCSLVMLEQCPSYSAV
ncbi:hypothetical protein ARMSODRAFT_957279 [Armillaria solidipes]|uniref:Uncharacterized protein n=1 Tax=Armillaria solidipes TaxID=1076256 RepID=A0A2H3C0C5_9AGAR|nr:hypothetical protein ARMSODRAFT_957279 [Armillaria solidipes]